MHMDVFRGDAFTLMPLTGVVNTLPHAPTQLRNKGWFQSEGINTLDISLELTNEKLTLVPTAPRGSPGVNKGLQRRGMKTFRSVHMPQEVTLLADEVNGLRAVGKETEEEVAMNRLKKKMAVAKRDNDITLEYQLMGALRGQVLDADGSTVLWDYNVEFGTTKPTRNVALSNNTTKVLQEMVSIERQVEDALGGLTFSGLTILCSPEWMDAFTGHPLVKESYVYQMSSKLRENYRKGFEFGGHWFEEYRGTVNGQRFLPAGKALVVPEGVPDMFKTYYSPAPYMETVGTDGLEWYAKQKNMDYDVGVTVQMQSNPLHVVERPGALLELTAT